MVLDEIENDKKNVAAQCINNTREPRLITSLMLKTWTLQSVEHSERIKF